MISEPGKLSRIQLPGINNLLDTLKPEPIQLRLITVKEILNKEQPLLSTSDIFKPVFGEETEVIGQRSDSTAVRTTGLPRNIDETFQVVSRIQDKGSGKKNNYYGVSDLKTIASNLGLNTKGKKKDLVQTIRNHVFTHKGLVDTEYQE